MEPPKPGDGATGGGGLVEGGSVSKMAVTVGSWLGSQTRVME